MSVTFMGFFLLVFEYYDHRGEGSGGFRVAELQSSSNESDFRFSVNEVVEVSCIGSRRNEHYDKGIGLATLLKRFLNPLANLFPIGRVTKYSFPPQS